MSESEVAIDRTDSGTRRTTAVLVVLILLLVLLLCGLVYIYRMLSGNARYVDPQADVPGVKTESTAYTFGADEPIDRPLCVAFDGKTVYVTQAPLHRVLAFDKDLTNGRVFAVGDPTQSYTSREQVTLMKPLGIDVDQAGNVYVADSEKAAVVVFNSQGEKLREMRVMGPRYVRYKDGRLYVLGKGTLYVLDEQGNAIGEYGTFGRGDDQLSYPGGLAIDDDANVYIADTNNYRIVALDADFNHLWNYGTPTDTRAEHAKRSLAAPIGIDLGADGNLYVVDSLNSYIRVFDTKGASISGPLGEYGSKENQFYYPLGISHMGAGLFAVTDRFNNRVVTVRLSIQPVTAEVPGADSTLESTPGVDTSMPPADNQP